MFFDYPSLSYEMLSCAFICMTLLCACYGAYIILEFVVRIYRNRYFLVEYIRDYMGIEMTSNLIHFMSGPVSSSYRQIFKDSHVENMVQHAAMRNHSHAEAARLRCYANTAMSSFITTLGYREYSVSRSLTEENNEVEGTRLYYHAKDLQMRVTNDPLCDQHMIKLTDVDYYVHMPDYLTGNHLIMYTFVPLTVAGNTTDGVYRVDNNGELDVHVNGGGHYNHPLWDYETDHVMVDHWWGTCFYLLESKNIAQDRKIIYFNHIRTIYGPLGWFIPGYRLRHRNLKFGNIAYIKSMVRVENKFEIQHSFASIRDNTCANILDKQLVAIRSRLRHSKAPTMSDVERIVRMDVQVDAHVIAAILYEVLSNQELSYLVSDSRHHPITTVEFGDNKYMPLGALVTEDGTAAIRKITEPYMNDAAHPVRSFNSDQSCIKGRIHDVKNPVRTVPPFYHQCLHEFARLLVPDHIANTLVPQDFSYMTEQWKRPTQRSLLDRVKHVLYHVKPWAVKSFQKAESYAKVTHPRNISTLPTGFNARLGQFYYPLSEFVMKPAHWYAFGRAPQEIGRAVMAKATGRQRVIIDDTTRLDGSCGEFHHLINKTCAIRAFAPQYKAELSSLLEREAHATGFTSFGLDYKADFNTLSGSSDTSTKNSNTTAFLHYVERRISGLQPIEAYEALGMYGGDDGITFDCNPDVLSRVYAKTGLLVKTDIVEAGGPVPFLGRYFLDPWTVPNSICDIPRQLRKLHLTATPKTVSTDLILLRKAEAILVTDPETPILSTWAKRVVDFTQHVDQRAKLRMEHLLLRDISYWSRFEDPFPPCENKDLVNTVAKSMFADPAKVDLLEAHLQQAIKLTDLPLLIDDTPPKVDIDAVVQGIVVTTKPSVSHQSKIQANANKKVKIVKPLKASPKPAKDHSIKQHPKFNTTSRIPIYKSKATPTAKPTETKRRGLCKYGKDCKRTKCPFQHKLD